MNDHELDDQIRHLAQSYNDPPTTPRDAMWSRIERAREDGTVVAIGTQRHTRWLRTAAGIAAVLAVGIGIGRLSRGSSSPSAPTMVAAAPRTAAPDMDVRPGVDTEIAAAGDATGGVGTAATESLASASREAESANRVRATREERLAGLQSGRRGASRGLAGYALPRPQGPGADPGESSAYRVAVVEHMARAEVLLTSFLADSRTSPTDTRTTAQFAALSRDLLKTTRLLLATRTGDDPTITRLLEDLELVLMQISQYSSEGRRGDLDAINQSIDRRNVLPKLRSAIPAGASTPTGI